MINSAVFLSYSLMRCLYSELAFSERIFRSLRILMVESLTKEGLVLSAVRLSLGLSEGGAGGVKAFSRALISANGS